MDWKNRQHVLKGLIFLYQRQTVDEQLGGYTVEDNAMGFNAVDAAFCTSVAKQILDDKRGISQKQYDAIIKIIFKYKLQLDNMDPDGVYLPQTAVVYDPKPMRKVDGEIRINSDKLIFHPYIYPSNQVTELGFKWLEGSNGKSAWVADVTMKRVNALKGMFTLTIDETIDTWIDSQTADKIVELGDDRVLHFQKQMIGFAVSANRAMVGAAPGLGKSLIGIFSAKLVGGKTLIVCPTSLMRNWLIEIDKWNPNAKAEIWHQKLSCTDGLDFVVVNYESIRDNWVDWDEKIIQKKSGKKAKKLINWRTIVDHDFDNLICDESAMIKNRNAQRSKAIEVLAKEFKRVWFLSGFPAKRYYDDLWMQFHILYPKRYTSYWRFAREYCYVDENVWGGYVIKTNQPDAAQRIKANTADFYISRTQEQVLDIPDWLFDDYNIDMHKDQYRLYTEMEEKFKAILPEGDVVLAPIVLTQLLRLVQFASNPLLLGSADNSGKWDAIEEILEFEQLPVIIWTAFIKTAEEMTHRLSKKLRVATLTGQTKPHYRQTIVNNFQDGEIDVLIAHPGVGKYGFTLTAGRTAIYLERTYDGDAYYQSLYRIRRIGTTQSPHVIHLLSSRPNGDNRPTVDHVIHKVLNARKEAGFQITAGEIRDAFE
jgi:superfamily II DNA or RNA helicase